MNISVRNGFHVACHVGCHRHGCHGYAFRSRVYRTSIAVALILCITPVLHAQTPTTKAAKPDRAVPQAGCVTAECHANIKAYKVLHGPVNVNACDACHKLADEKAHKFELTRAKTQICTFCHKMETGSDPVIHKPIKDGDCLPCHNPHGSVNKTFIRAASMNDLCKSCHVDVLLGKKMIHGPAAAGACGACHQAHSSRFPKLLSAQGNELCFGCHTEMKAQMKKVKFTHKAVEDQCTKCHDAHASNYAKQTTQPANQLCTSCHEKIKKDALDASHKHSVVVQENGCINCHTAHGGDLAKLMRSEQIKVCMNCHDKKIDAGGGRSVAALPEVLDAKTVKHGPIAQGSCGGCHNVHGGNVSRLLVQPYSELFYEPFNVDKYSLCFTCHDKQLVLMKETANLTNFRNGQTNLHYLHVNKTTQGRSCRACHSTHASKNPLHIRESVPYGSWTLPVNYTPTKNGGECAAGCHKKLAYDRVSKIELEPEAPQTMPAVRTGVIPSTTRPVTTTQSVTTTQAVTTTSAPSSAPASRPAPVVNANVSQLRTNSHELGRLP